MAALERDLRGFVTQRTGLLMALCLIFGVGTSPAGWTQDATQLDEVVVQSERSGPGLWHVHRPGADLWILGSMSPLPKGITWRSKQVERLLDRTDTVLIPKPFEVGIVRVLWLLITERSLLMVPGGKRLKDVMPPELYSRFALQRAKYGEKSDKWERFRPLIASAFLQQDAFHAAGLSTRLDLGAAVRVLAEKRRVPVEQIKMAGMHDVLDALKTMPPGAENTCVEASLVIVEKELPRLVERANAWSTGNVELIEKLREPPEVDACLAALERGAGASELLTLLRRSWLDGLDTYLRRGGLTLAVLNMDMLLEKGGLLDGLRAKGYEIDSP